MGKAGKGKSLTQGGDEVLREALRRAYALRAALFVREIGARSLANITTRIEALDARGWDWQLVPGISEGARSKVQQAGVGLHLVFCHPLALQQDKEFRHYYRNLAALSKKGLGQILHGLPSAQREHAACSAINEILSAVIDGMATFDLAVLQMVIPAELGSEIQGTWVNLVGKGAAAYVEDLISAYGTQHGHIRTKDVHQVVVKGRNRKFARLTLSNGYTIIFAAEPDISIRNERDVLVGAVEIKGSIDRAGAQTRYGEAKKSFSKALRENGQCETIYLASCFTTSVIEQIRQDAQVRKVFNLARIMSSEEEAAKFLSELFDHVIRIAH